MPIKPPVDILTQAQAVLDAWNQIDNGASLGNIAPAALSADIAQAAQMASQLNALEAQITNLRNQREALHLTLWDKVKRVRNSVKGTYGDDSSQYEMIGGTRVSDRKPYTRKVKPAA